MIHERPEYVINFKKPKNTEIKYINGHWYLYERTSMYNPATKKMHKKSGQLLGTITESGFIPKKPKVDHSCFENVDVVELGASGYLWAKNSDLAARLEKMFPDYWRELFAIAVLRITDSPRFKRLDDAYESSCLRVLFPGLNLDKNNLTSLLKSIGKRRTKITEFMKDDSDSLSSYMIFDGHRVISDSETLETAQMGYDSRRRFKNQVNLVYAFSVSGERCFPYYYKQFSGDVPDITAFSALVKEAGIEEKKLTMLADKGFGSADNFSLLESYGFHYIIPVKRTNIDSKDNLPETPAGYDQTFTYRGRSVLHKEVSMNGYKMHLFMDATLFAYEMNDFTARLEKENKTIALQKETEEKLRAKGKGRLTDEELLVLRPIAFKEAYENRVGIGTLALRTNDMELNGEQVYYLYKRRQAIEEFFKTYDDTLEFASSYMRDEKAEEAWLFLNHLSSMMAFSLMDEIYLKGKSKDVSLKDFVSILSRIHADKINNEWHCAKITKKRADFAKNFNLDISALIKDLNAMDALL